MAGQFCGDEKLCVISIAVKVNSKVAENVTTGEDDEYDEWIWWIGVVRTLIPGAHFDGAFFPCTNWVLLDRYEVNQGSAVTLTPVPASSSSRECEILSKAALRLRMMVRRAVSSARRIFWLGLFLCYVLVRSQTGVVQKGCNYGDGPEAELKLSIQEF